MPGDKMTTQLIPDFEVNALDLFLFPLAKKQPWVRLKVSFADSISNQFLFPSFPLLTMVWQIPAHDILPPIVNVESS